MRSIVPEKGRGLKEKRNTDHKHRTDEDAQARADEVEHHKQDQLKAAQKTGQGKEKSELDTDSGEAVRGIITVGII